jgi:hypothetical protein
LGQPAGPHEGSALAASPMRNPRSVRRSITSRVPRKSARARGGPRRWCDGRVSLGSSGTADSGVRVCRAASWERARPAVDGAA